MTSPSNPRYRAAALMASLLLSGQAQAAPGDLESFGASKYTFCDAEFLSAYWGQSVEEAKTHAGHKLSIGAVDYVRAAVEGARAQAIQNGQRCDFFESAYSYDDAALLASYWGVQVDEAKSIVEDKLTHGHDAVIKSALIDAVSLGDAQPRPANGGANAELDRFFSSAFTYCDARLLADHWGQSLADSKARIGRKLIWGDAQIVHEMLSDARTDAKKRGTTCQFFETGLDYADVEKLAAHWKVSVTDAKIRAADIYTQGLSKDLSPIISSKKP